jgi:hypothetical protein
MDQKIRPNEVSRAGEGGAKRGTPQYYCTQYETQETSV